MYPYKRYRSTKRSASPFPVWMWMLVWKLVFYQWRNIGRGRKSSDHHSGCTIVRLNHIVFLLAYPGFTYLPQSDYHIPESIHPGKLTWKPTWRRFGRWFSFFNWVIFRFHVSFQGCSDDLAGTHPPTGTHLLFSIGRWRRSPGCSRFTSAFSASFRPKKWIGWRDVPGVMRPRICYWDIFSPVHVVKFQYLYHDSCCKLYPIGSMYGISTYIGPFFCGKCRQISHTWILWAKLFVHIITDIIATSRKQGFMRSALNTFDLNCIQDSNTAIRCLL